MFKNENYCFIYQWNKSHDQSRKIYQGIVGEFENLLQFSFENLYSITTAKKKKSKHKSNGCCDLCRDPLLTEDQVSMLLTEMKTNLLNVLLMIIFDYFDCDICRDYYWCDDNTYYITTFRKS